jgi:RES domain-containing protein
MPRRIYRVCRSRYARLDGEGARLAGGRWNSPGRVVVYMAESIALAVLENLVHMTRQDFQTGYICVAAVLPDDTDFTTEKDLRQRAGLRKPDAQTLGDWWIDSRETAVLEVPSIFVPNEHNYLLNPAPSGFRENSCRSASAFSFRPTPIHTSWTSVATK